jgi:hypothetical protein
MKSLRKIHFKYKINWKQIYSILDAHGLKRAGKGRPYSPEDLKKIEQWVSDYAKGRDVKKKGIPAIEQTPFSEPKTKHATPNERLEVFRALYMDTLTDIKRVQQEIESYPPKKIVPAQLLRTKTDLKRTLIQQEQAIRRLEQNEEEEDLDDLLA